MSRGRLLVEVFNAHPTSRLRKDPVSDSVRRVLVAHSVRAAEVRVILVDDEELLRMNREHLGHDWYTDVITFPLEEDPLEGEIYISVDRAREQAAEHSVALGDEVRRLAVHGALHLVGYDDASPEQRAAMAREEDKFLGA